MIHFLQIYHIDRYNWCDTCVFDYTTLAWRI